MKEAHIGDETLLRAGYEVLEDVRDLGLKEFDEESAGEFAISDQAVGE